MATSPFTLIDKLPIEGRRTLIRVDFNVPLDGDRVADDSRIRAALPTIRNAVERGARVVLCSHLGRPKGEVVPELSLAPAGEVLAGLLDRDVLLSDRPVGDGPTRLVRDLRDGQILLLENIRFHPGETKNDDGLARALAAYADCFVNDAFGTAHRAHASTVGVTAHVRDKAAGFLMGREVKALGRLLAAPRKGFTAVLGGAKVSDKIAILERLLTKVDTLLIGGAMAYTFLAAKGIDIGASRCEEAHLVTARRILDQAEKRGIDVVLPLDHVAAKTFDKDAEPRTIATPEIDDGWMALDIGPKTAAAFAQRIAAARTIFWNGPLGVFEFPAFAAGTRAIAEAVADASAWAVVGGGDSVRAVNESGRAGDIGHISTGGGASMAFLEGRELPALRALGYRGRA